MNEFAASTREHRCLGAMLELLLRHLLTVPAIHKVEVIS